MSAIPTPAAARLLSHAQINALAEEAGPIADADPMTWARRLGFALLPCGAKSSPEWDLSTPSVAAFDPWRERPSLVAAVARGLLLRAGVEHRPADADALAARLMS